MILVSNDDGIDAAGIIALAKAMAKVSETIVIAPDRNWSAAGHAKTMHRPLRVRKVHFADNIEAYKCDGAPSDCVALALMGFLPQKPALVVSGINTNSNVGSDITYSGTVAAAMEAALVGVPAIAVSLDKNEDSENYATAADFAAKLAKHVLAQGMPPETLLNVNVPDVPADEIKGVRITRAGKRIYYDELIKRNDPFGQPYYWIGGPKPGGDHELEGTDIWAIARGYISVTPIHMDMTNHARIEALEETLKHLG